jgi:hypothetical protein
MFPRVLSLLLLSASLAFAQQGLGNNNGGMTRGNLLRIPDYKTTGTARLDPAGADTNNCTSASTPCLTILGLQAKMPKVIRNPTTIVMANGSYSGGWFSEFQFDPADSAIGSYTLLQGTITTFAPATGTATGTASAAANCVSATPPSSPASLTDGTQTWTANNLRGQLIPRLPAAPAQGSSCPDSNTGTVITIAGCWAPTRTRQYLRDSGLGCEHHTTSEHAAELRIGGGRTIGLGLHDARQPAQQQLGLFLHRLHQDFGVDVDRIAVDQWC